MASSVWFWLGVFGCVVLVRPNCYWLCWLWPDYEWLCLAELVGLGCAVLVVAGLCSAWRPPPPASMKAAAWPATAFLHSRAAAQLPTQLCCTTITTTSRVAAQLPPQLSPHYHHNYHHNSAAQPPQLLPPKSCRTALPRIIETRTADAAIDRSAYKLQPNTTTQLREPISAHSKPTHTTTSEAGATTHKTANNRTPTTPQPMEARTSQATIVNKKLENKWM